MKSEARFFLDAARRYNPSDDFLRDAYGISSTEALDAFVLAPAWTPDKLLSDWHPKIEERRCNSSTHTSIVEFSGLRLGWLQFGIGACSLMDAALPLADSRADRLIFVGSVGALKPDLALGALITPSECYSYDSSSIYLRDGLDAANFGRTVTPHCSEWIDRVLAAASEERISIEKRRVFCTDSVICEYAKLEQIHATGAEAIEMETAAFYECARMIEKDAIALLCVSDNSAAGVGLVGRSEEDTRRYHESRFRLIPKMIELACKTEIMATR